MQVCSYKTLMSEIKRTPLTSSLPVVSPRMEINQPVHRYQPVTSYLSSSISTSPSCFEISVVLLVFKKLLKNHPRLSQFFSDTWDAQDALGPCNRRQYHFPKAEKKHFTECFCPLYIYIILNTLPSPAIEGPLLAFIFNEFTLYSKHIYNTFENKVIIVLEHMVVDS